MSTCVQCETRDAKPYGSQHYARRDLCLGCFFDWFQAKTKAEDALKAQVAYAVGEQLTPHQAHAGEPGATPVWRPGANVAVKEKACDRCGVLITIRKNGNGKNYPANHGTTTPHWKACTNRVVDGEKNPRHGDRG